MNAVKSVGGNGGCSSGHSAGGGGGDDDAKSMSDDDDGSSYVFPELDEIPVWVRGEQRWISGLNEDTTCGQLVEALLRDEGLKDDGETMAGKDSLNQYVISEKWRRVEQVLSSSTKVLKIWNSWGESQTEVRCVDTKIYLTNKILILIFNNALIYYTTFPLNFH